MIRNHSTSLWLAALALAYVATGAQAESAYVVSPASPNDPRNAFQTPQSSVYVVDGSRGTITMCYPDNKDNHWSVVCLPATPLPK
jgi:streptogramin lyase